MMSHIFIENIFMSPFPSFEIPKMITFRTNTDSSSIINGEYLLESSLHPAPASSWLDFRYKERKKSVERHEKGNDENTHKTIDFTLFCFTVCYYSAKKFMFSKLSRKYRYFDFDTKGEFYLGLFLVQSVLWSTWSTSCVRHGQRLYFQYSLYSLITQIQMPSENIAS